jgi:hypothetical protein
MAEIEKANVTVTMPGTATDVIKAVRELFGLVEDVVKEGAALQLGEARMGTPTKSWSPAYRPTEISHPRIHLTKERRLQEASASGWNTHAGHGTRLILSPRSAFKTRHPKN